MFNSILLSIRVTHKLRYYGQRNVKKQRPVNLQLNTISFPPAALTSILHRVTGVAMFFALMFVIWAWAVSVSSAEGFSMVQEQMAGPLGKFIAIGTLSALSYHILGGLRHLVMDMGYWEELESGSNSAKATIVLWIILTIVVGVVLW
jgi:succinate dehydrogenase / fumarate reductase cytochrome b subunit